MSGPWRLPSPAYGKDTAIIDDYSFARAGIADLPDVARLHWHCIRETGGAALSTHDGFALEYAVDQYFANGESLRDLSAWLVRDNWKYVSLCIVSFSRLPPDVTLPHGLLGRIHTLYTIPAYRGQGLGVRILELCLADAESLGCDRIVVFPPEPCRFPWKRHGFTPGSKGMARILGR